MSRMFAVNEEKRGRKASERWGSRSWAFGPWSETECRLNGVPSAFDCVRFVREFSQAIFSTPAPAGLLRSSPPSGLHGAAGLSAGDRRSESTSVWRALHGVWAGDTKGGPDAPSERLRCRVAELTAQSQKRRRKGRDIAGEGGGRTSLGVSCHEQRGTQLGHRGPEARGRVRQVSEEGRAAGVGG